MLITVIIIRIICEILMKINIRLESKLYYTYIDKYIIHELFKFLTTMNQGKKVINTIFF